MLPDNTTTVKNDTTQVKKRLAVGIKVTYKKAVYKITRSTSKSAEVTLLYIKSKKVKKFTIPTKIKLSDGRKAKVTGIAKKAFNKCKKLTTVKLPKKIQTIRGTFGGKKNCYLKKVYINATSLKKCNLKSIPKTCKIYVKNKKVKQQVKGAGFKGKILIR